MKDIDYWQLEVNDCIKQNRNNRVVRKNNIDLKNIVKNSINSLNDMNYNFSTYEKEFNDRINTNNVKIVKNESLGIDNSTIKKLKTGKYKIDKTIDFHGKTLDEAFDILIKEINIAYKKGLRCLLVITGKGLRSPENSKTIKNEINNWLNHQLIADKIITYTDAIQKDGGTGAVYVLLKRNKDLSCRKIRTYDTV